MAMLAAVLATFGGDSGTTVDVSPLLSFAGQSGSPKLRCHAALLSGHELLLRGQLRQAAAALWEAFAVGERLSDPDLLSNLALGAVHLGEDAVADRTYLRLLAVARNNGALSLVIHALARHPFAQIPAGRWGAAAATSAEAINLAGGTGQVALTALPLAMRTVLAALRNEPPPDDALQQLRAVTSRHAAGVTIAVVEDLTAWAQGVLAAAASEPAAALHQLQRIAHPAIRGLAALDRLEAAVHAEQPDLANYWVNDLAAFAEAVDAAWAAAAADHGRALLSDGGEAEDHFQRALAHHGRGIRPVDRARTHLAYGGFLRRAGRRVEARAQLRAALAVFDEVGASSWAERTRNELRASGETARKRDVSTLENLTAQERLTAELVSQGLSNREVAARLFLSPRTVEFHLSHAYQKLGIASRRELTKVTFT
jgi:DNA-binding CsgD family transcriptional regulator